jgi:hypothetical protein
LPPALLATLRKRHEDRRLDRVCGDLGLRVEEDWILVTGEMVTVGYRVPPGRVDGKLTDAATGQPLSDAWLCRSKHVASRVERCASCMTVTCSACPDAVEPCELCGDRLCQRCVATPDGRCPACAALRKVGLLARGRFNLARGVKAWYGEGPHGRVVVRHAPDGWWVDRLHVTGAVTIPLTGERLELARIVLGFGTDE